MSTVKPIVVYPRGFYGFDIGLTVREEKDDIDKVYNSLRFNKVKFDRDRRVISNDVVADIFVRTSNNYPGTSTLAYRENTILAALKAFGTKSFYEWCQIQENNPYFSDIHKRFMNDTFKFIRTGERDINILNWDSLVRINNNDRIILAHAKTPYLYKEFFKMNQASLFRRPFGVSSLIQSWTSQAGGFEDMVRTLYILFCDDPHFKRG